MLPTVLAGNIVGTLYHKL